MKDKIRPLSQELTHGRQTLARCQGRKSKVTSRKSEFCQRSTGGMRAHNWVGQGGAGRPVLI